MTHTVTINELRPGNEYPGGGINSRKDYTREEIDARKASLLEFGLLQSLLVCPAPDADVPPYYVAGGGLRLAALGELINEKKLDHNFQIEVTIRPDFDSAMALAASIEENREVLPTHPAAVYEQFAVLKQRGRDEDAIAKLYGMKKKDVLGILALGSLHADIRQAWRDGKISREIAETFTLEPDQKRQISVFKKLTKNGGTIYRDDIRSELIGDGDSCSSLVNFVGREAYEVAGGKVMVDLFREEHGVSDPALAKRMADEKLQGVLEQLVAEGWAWAKLADDLPQGWHWQWSKIDVKPHYTAEEKTRLAAIEKRNEELTKVDEEDGGLDDAQVAEGERLDAEKDAIEQAASARAFKPEQKKKSGVVVKLTNGGRLDLQCGIIKPADVKNVPNKDLSSVDRQKKQKKAKAAGLSDALNQRLSEALTYATAEALAKQPEIAIPAMLAGFGAATMDCAVRVEEKGLAERRGEGRGAKRDVSFTSIFDTMLKADTKRRLEALAAIAGRALDFQCQSAARKPLADKSVAAICNALDGKALNAAIRAKFNAEDYFGGVNSTLRLQAIKDACGDDAAGRAAKLKKGEQAAFAVANVPKTGWLPPELRTSHYDGPAAKKATVTKLKPKAKATKKAAPKRRAA